MKSVLKKQNKGVNSKCVDRIVVASHMGRGAVVGAAAVVVGILVITTIGITSSECVWGRAWNPQCR